MCWIEQIKLEKSKLYDIWISRPNKELKLKNAYIEQKTNWIIIGYSIKWSLDTIEKQNNGNS